MPDVVCAHCREVVEAQRGRCPRCGNVAAVEALGIQADAAPEWTPPQDRGPAPTRTTPYADWEDFRDSSAALNQKLAELATRALPDLRGVRVIPVPENAPPETDAWGRPRGTVILRGDDRATAQIVNAILWGAGLLIIAAGLAMALGAFDAPEADRKGKKAANDAAPLQAILAFAVGGACLAGGAWYAFLRKQGFASILWVFDKGILCERGNQLLACPWEEVEAFRINQGKGHRCALLRMRGDTSEISAEEDPSVMPLLEYMEIKLTAAQFLPLLRRIFAGERIHLHAVNIDRVGFEGPRFYAFWSDIERIVSDPEFLFVVRHEATEWYRVRYAEASMALLILALAHVLIEECKLLPETA